MKDVEFDGELVDFIRQQPYPPRRYPSNWIWRFVFNRAALWFYLFAVFMGAVAVINYLRLSGDIMSTEGGVFFWSVCLCSLGLLILPLYGALERHYAIRAGRIGRARVERVTTTASTARGEWSVLVGDDRFSAAFALREQWAPRLGVGSSVQVLVHPTRQQVLLAVGP